MKARNPLFLREEELERAVYLILLSDLGMTATLDAIQEEAGLSANLTRIIILLHNDNSMGTSEIRALLGLPKQTLSNQIRDLTERGFIEASHDPYDQRKLRFSLTISGQELSNQMSAMQKRYIKRAYAEAGSEAVEGFLSVMNQLVDVTRAARNNRLRR